MPPPQLSPEVLDKLCEYDTPTVCNVIELFAVRPQTEGYMDARIRACFPDMGPVCGYASTATFRSALARRGRAPTARCRLRWLGSSRSRVPPIVVIQDLDAPTKAATFGEVMASTYKAFGAQALITSGAGRDLDQVHAVGLPCFADGCDLLARLPSSDRFPRPCAYWRLGGASGRPLAR